MFVFREIWRPLFSWKICFEIRPFTLLLKIWAHESITHRPSSRSLLTCSVNKYLHKKLVFTKTKASFFKELLSCMTKNSGPYFQKQPFYRIVVLENLAKFTRTQLQLSSIFSCRSLPAFSQKIGTHYRCIPMNFTKFFGTAIL